MNILLQFYIFYENNYFKITNFTFYKYSYYITTDTHVYVSASFF